MKNFEETLINRKDSEAALRKLKPNKSPGTGRRSYDKVLIWVLFSFFFSLFRITNVDYIELIKTQMKSKQMQAKNILSTLISKLYFDFSLKKTNEKLH